MVVIQSTQNITVFTLQIQNYLCIYASKKYNSREKKLKLILPVLWISDFDFPLLVFSNWNEKKKSPFMENDVIHVHLKLTLSNIVKYMHLQKINIEIKLLHTALTKNGSVLMTSNHWQCLNHFLCSKTGSSPGSQSANIPLHQKHLVWSPLP